MATAHPGAVTDQARVLAERLGERALEAEELRRLPDATIEDFNATDLGDVLVPRRWGGLEAPVIELLEAARELAHGCTSSAWVLTFFALHRWMAALFDEETQGELLGAEERFFAPAPLAPTGRALPCPDGLRLSGRWSWASGVMHANWVIVGALAGPDDAPFPALVVCPRESVDVEDVWRTSGMRATGSNDVVASDVRVPERHVVAVRDVFGGTAPGAEVNPGAIYRWPLVPLLALSAAMPALGTAERLLETYTARLGERVALHTGTAHRDRPAAQMRLGQASVRLSAARDLTRSTAGEIQRTVERGERVSRGDRVAARLAAAHVVRESKLVIDLLVEASGGSAHFVAAPFQRAQRDVNTLAGHVIFDYDVSTELAGAQAVGLELPRAALV